MQGAARGQRAQRDRGRSAGQRGDGGSLPTQKVGFEPHSPVCGASVRLGEQQFVVACVHTSLQKHQSTATEHQACTWPMTWPRGARGIRGPHVANDVALGVLGGFVAAHKWRGAVSFLLSVTARFCRT